MNALTYIEEGWFAVTEKAKLVVVELKETYDQFYNCRGNVINVKFIKTK